MVVGWYHSHPGFGCWLSGVDMNTQTSFEQLNARAVAVVVDPVQSVKGKVVIDAFRMIAGQGGMMMMPMAQGEPRQTTSNVGFLKKPTIQARIHGLDRHYYSLVIDWRKNDLEEQVQSICCSSLSIAFKLTPTSLLADVDEPAQERLDHRPAREALRGAPAEHRPGSTCAATPAIY